MDVNAKRTTPAPVGSVEAEHDAVNGANGKHASPADAFKTAGKQVGELREYASYFLSAQIDAMKASARNAVLYAVLGIVGLLAGGAIVVTAAAMVVMGLGVGLGKLFRDDLAWLGPLIVGVVVLGCIGLGAWLMLSRVMNGFRRSTVNKYEQRQSQQREQLGRDVAERAASEGKVSL